MEDQLFAEAPSLESLIEQGQVTHLCSRAAGTAPSEAAVLNALCAAVAGEIYRIDSLNFVFRVEDTDLDGALAGAPFQKWASLLGEDLLKRLNCAAEPRPLYVRALVKSQTPLASKKVEASAPPVIEEVSDMPAEVLNESYAAGSEDMASGASDAPSEWAASPDEWSEAPGGSDPEPAMDAGSSALADAVARIEQAVAGTAVEERLAALDQRFERIESTLAALCAEVAGQREDARSTERLIDDLAQECRKLPERTARHVAARADGLGPIASALSSVLQRLESRLEEPGHNGSLEKTLMALQAQIAAINASLPFDTPSVDDTAARLATIEEELKRVPERAAVHLGARATALAPVHVALSGALHRLECQIETLLDRSGPNGPAVAPDLPTQMAEFLARMERHFGDQPVQ